MRVPGLRAVRQLGGLLGFGLALAALLWLTGCAYQTPEQRTAAIMAPVWAQYAQQRAEADARTEARKDAYAQLRPGMTMTEVRSAWGTPWQTAEQVTANGGRIMVLVYCLSGESGYCYQGLAKKTYLQFSDGILLGWSTY